jgi:hypothetical protein
MKAIEYLDRPPAGWFVLDVMQKEARGRGFVSPASTESGIALGTFSSK